VPSVNTAEMNANAESIVQQELERRAEVGRSEAQRIRRLFKLASAVLICALAWQLLSLRSATTFNLLGAINLFGLLVLTLVGALDAPPGRVRLVQTALALAIVIPASIWLQVR
jgi:CHASE2 domain-containing sensor protein